jgi:hypothetical protein
MDENAKWDRRLRFAYSAEPPRSSPRARGKPQYANLSLFVAALLLGACGDFEPHFQDERGNSAGTAGFAGASAVGGSTSGGNAGAAGSAGGGMMTNRGGSSGVGGSSADGGRAGDGSGGKAAASGSDGGSGISGASGVAGRGGAAGAAGAGGGGGNVSIPRGTCCASGDCLCHGPDPSGLTSANGPFDTATFTISTGTVHYPTDAEPPFAAVALCGGFLNTGPEMAPWGPFYASHGIVTIITTTTGADLPDLRATKLLASIEAIKAENTKSGSPLNGKLAGRYGTSGYSMGGGGTTIASVTDPTLRSSVGLAPWAPVGDNVRVPTLLLCGATDGTAPCDMSETAYTAIDATTPKMMVIIPATAHLAWFGPKDAGDGISGETALAFQKVFLEGDERWRPFLLQAGGTKTTNIE